MKKYDYLDISSFVEELMEKKESAEIEFKSAAGGFPKAFWETYSSFANTNGGTIVLGIKEKKGEFYVDSLTDELIDKYKKEFWSGVNNRDIVNLNLLSNDDVVDGELDGHKVLLFIYLELQENNVPSIILLTLTMEFISVITKETSNVLNKRLDACMLMPMFQYLLIHVY